MPARKSPEPILVGDIGGTKTRLAVVECGGKPKSVKTFLDDDIFDLAGLLRVEISTSERRPATAVLGVAAPIDGDLISMTNRAWSFSIKRLRRALELRQLIVINDFAAIAHAVPFLSQKELARVGGNKHAQGNLLVCGPGTGFGTAALVRNGRRYSIVSSEAGHMALGATNSDETRILSMLSAGKRLVAEDILSSSGLERLYRAISGRKLNSVQIVARANAGNRDALNTIRIFLGFFGRIAGDLALAFNARGGVYVAGNLGQSLLPFMRKSGFRKSFESHPPYKKRLASIPIYVIMHPAPGLLGASKLAGLKAE